MQLFKFKKILFTFVVKQPTIHYYMRIQIGTTFKRFVLLALVGVLLSCTPEVYLKPIIETTDVSNVTESSVETGGLISSDEGSLVSARGVCWSTNPNPTIKDQFSQNAAGTGSFTSIITGLNPSTTYFLRAYATNKGGTAYGLQVTFTTKTLTLTSIPAYSVMATTAMTGGLIASNGDSIAITARGVCWNTFPNPTVEDSITKIGSGKGSYNSLLSGLKPQTTYFVRAYVTNSVGTYYGNEVSFTTMSGVIDLTTTNATSISMTYFNTGGTIRSDGGATINDKGVCWSTTQNPTILDSKKSIGSGSSTFSLNISGLTKLTTYYIRAYATNNIGISYGNQISVTTTDVDLSKVIDIDGNEYATIKIGNQLWMASNLKTTRYRNGDPIVNMTNYTVWVTLTSGAYCDYDNLTSNGTTYGHLYNWYAVNDSRNIAPTGWHIPTDAEWDVLVAFLGGPSVAGGKMKETGTSHWMPTNYGATNESGFTALPGGGSNTQGWNINTYGYWWSSTEYNSTKAWFRYIYKDDTNIVRTYDNSSKTLGYSVRCIKD